jgi:hypothetical protein
MLKLLAEPHPESLLSDRTSPPTLPDPHPGHPSRLTLDPSRSRTSMVVFPDPPREPVPLTKAVLPDPPREPVPSTKTENDPSLGSETPSVPVSVLEVVLPLLARLSLMIDNGRCNSKNDLDPGSRFMMTEPSGITIGLLETGPCPPTDLNRHSATDPSPT